MIASREPPRTPHPVRIALSYLVDLALPRACVSCDELFASTSDVVCESCWCRLSPLPHPHCDRCGHPTQGRRCGFCELLPPFVRSARSVCWVPHVTGSAVLRALKYHGWTSAATGIAERMSRLSWPDDVSRERAALVPVPLSRSRERERGFNQAALIAEALAAHWHIPVWHDALLRTRATETQTRLTPSERAANVNGAFEVPLQERNRVKGQHLVIVDDVLTTGATMNNCAEALFLAGARTMSYVTFGRARTSGDGA